jgi:hypothetical protein
VNLTWHMTFHAIELDSCEKLLRILLGRAIPRIVTAIFVTLIPVLRIFRVY